MPAVMIRQLDAMAKVMSHTVSGRQRDVLLAQAEMIMRSAEESVPEPADRDDVRHRHAALLAAAEACSARERAQAAALGAGGPR
jgi:uncharacterized membrane protein